MLKIGPSVRLNTLDHNVITIPNNKVLTEVTSKGTTARSRCRRPRLLDRRRPGREPARYRREACLTSPFVFLDQPVPIFVKQVIVQDYVALHVKARPYVF